MIFLDQRRELASQLGVDQTNSEMDTRLKRWLNMSQRLILGSFPWPFLRASNPLIIQTVPDYSTGTVSTVAESSSITFSTPIQISSTLIPSRVNFYIQFSNTNDWYKVVSHGTSGAIEFESSLMTISPPAIATNTTAKFILRKIYYSLSSEVDRVMEIKQFVTPYKLNEITKEMFDSMQPIMNTTGNPTNFMMLGKDSSDVWQIGLWPNPSTTLNLHVEYMQMVNDLSGDNDVSIIPSKWHTTIMIEGAKMYGFDFLDDTRATDSKTMFYKLLEGMKEESQPSKSLTRRLRSIDQAPYLSEFPYPSNYPYGGS